MKIAKHRSFSDALLFQGVISWLCLCFVSSALADFKTPTLTVKPYSQLDFPPQLSKIEIQQTLTITASRLYGESFVDLGDMSDFMHGHALFYPLDPNAPPPQKQLVQKGFEFPWETVNLRGLLFHTQEYSFLRKDKEYRNDRGELLDRFNRNWIFWSLDTMFGLRGSLSKADAFDRRNLDKRPLTISSADLKEEVFGKEASAYEYSFYFFRVHGQDVDKLNLSPEQFAASNIIMVPLAGQNIFLVLVNFHCRNHSEDKAYCRQGPELSPFYPSFLK